ncbi:MAG: hypothetical protein ABIX28_25105 [Vicinamibacterales bacterium]
MIDWLPVVLSGVLALGPTTPAAAPTAAATDVSVRYGAMLNDAFRRVRAADSQVKRLLEEGLKRSVTFGDLVAAVNASDVIVYIQRVERLGPAVAGQLMIVPQPNAQRYLRIQILNHLSPEESIALIGHELRHALEVAASPDVRDQQGLIALYQRIGERGGMVHSFDTRAAQNTGRRVKKELIG